MPSASQQTSLRGRYFSSLLVRPASVDSGEKNAVLEELRGALCKITGISVSGLCAGRLIVVAETDANVTAFEERFRQIQALPGVEDVALVSAVTDLEDGT